MKPHEPKKTGQNKNEKEGGGETMGDKKNLIKKEKMQVRVYFSLTPNAQHIILVFVLIILEGAITVDVFLNRNWEEVRGSSAVNCSNSCHLPYFLCLISFKLNL
jgi:hypothetical protein